MTKWVSILNFDKNEDLLIKNYHEWIVGLILDWKYMHDCIESYIKNLYHF